MHPLSYHMVDALQPLLPNLFEHAADDLSIIQGLRMGAGFAEKENNT